MKGVKINKEKQAFWKSKVGKLSIFYTAYNKLK